MVSIWRRRDMTYQPDNIPQVDPCQVQGIRVQGGKALNGSQLHKECWNTRQCRPLGTARRQEFFQIAFLLVQSL